MSDPITGPPLAARVFSAYCERAGPGFWDEPLNALTNAAFLLAALHAALLLRRRAAAGAAPDRPVALLTGVAALIAAGSFAFHTRPGPVTVLLDVVPIQLLVVGYLVLALRRYLALSAPLALALAAAFLAASYGLVPPRALRGGAGYLPALAALAVVGALGLARGGPARRAGWALLAAALTFAASLTFRTLDGPLCAAVPFGLHWAWHLLNAVVIALLLDAAARHGPRAA